MLSAGSSDEQLTGSFLGSHINSDSQVPLIQTDIACELGLINFEENQLTHERQGCGNREVPLGFVVKLVWLY